MNSPSFKRWAEGTAEVAEARQWDRWISESEKNREKSREALARLSGFDIDEPALPDLDEEWRKVEGNLKSDTFRNSVKFPVKAGYQKSLTWFYRIAAVLLIGFFVGWVVFPNYSPEEPQEAEQVVVETITSDFGEKKTINLSDGSTIVLAAGSEITYQEDWLSKPVKRLRLEGEAYFSIVPTEQVGQPKFVVETEDGDAAVWGTKFTVSTYGEGTQVVLEEGEVRVTVEGVSQSGEQGITMTPGQLVNFTKFSQDIAIREVNTLVYTSWASDKLVFDDTPVSHLINRIQRTYDVDVEVRNEEIMDRKLSGSVNFKDLDSLIRAVSEVLKIDISRTDRTVYINGTKPNRVNQ